MLVKFENKSHRVKGLSFHSKRPWILASLYDGVIQLWDYRVCTLIEKFEGHEGPVRAVSFHHCQPIFVSGGDDNHIKVWNYQESKLLFTLKGHIDYIRTAFFHRENPWIVSASDDNTMKIWNWQSRQCISTVTGHSHYVMCAQFHPTQPLLVSCSLDQSMRLWDITGLKNKYYNPQGSRDSDKIGSIDILANVDVVVKSCTEFEKGVNWVCFHQSEPLILAASDERTIKVFKFNDYGVTEINVLRGHYNNVCCSVFNNQGNYIISASEDKSIRVWDGLRYIFVSATRRENDRFWIVAVSPNNSLIAAGHDSGFILFKIHREKPAFDVYNNQILYLKDKFLKKFDPIQYNDSTVMELKSHVRHRPASIYYNPIENMALINYSWYSEGPDNYFVELCNISPSLKSSDEISKSIKINAFMAVWVSRNRFACIDKNQTLLIKNIKDETLNTISIGRCKSIFYAGTGLAIAQVSDKLLLIDVRDSNVITSLTFQNTRFVHWSNDFSRVALVSIREILVVTKDFKILTRHSESARIKSCAFDSENSSILIYTTHYHIKYILIPHGDHGIVRTLDAVYYIVYVKNNHIACLDREAKAKILAIDSTEYQFKLALIENRYEEVLSIIRSSSLVGQALISFVREKGFPEIALHFIKDDKTRFYLSLECLNLPLALEMAKKMDITEYWSRLAAIALKLGEISISEECYIRLQDFHSLSLLYLITGNLEKLKKAVKSDNSFDSKAVSCLYLGDAHGFAAALCKIGSYSLSAATSITHSIPEITQSLKSQVAFETFSNLTPSDSFLASIPSLVNTLSEPWPKLKASKNIFDILIDSSGYGIPNGVKKDQITPILMENRCALWDEDLDDNETVQIPDKVFKHTESTSNAWNASDEDLGLDEYDNPSEPLSDNEPLIESKQLFSSRYLLSKLAIIHVMIGSFSSAFSILNKKFGVVNFSPIKELFLQTYFNTKILIPAYFSLEQAMMSYLDPVENGILRSPFTLDNIQNCIEEGCSLTTAANFVEAKAIFLETLHKLLFVVVDNKKQISELKEIQKTCREYIIGLSLEIERRSIKNDQIRIAELASYFTNCDIRPVHSILVLKIAMVLLFKLKNFRSACVLAKRLLDLAPSVELSQQARKIVIASEKSGLTNETELNYDEMNPFDVCCMSFTPIYRGDKKIVCPFCHSSYKPEFESQICYICKIGEIGVEAKGFSINSIDLVK